METLRQILFFLFLFSLGDFVDNVEIVRDVCQKFEKKTLRLQAFDGVVELALGPRDRCSVLLEPGGLFEVSVVENSQKKNESMRLKIFDEIVQRRASRWRHCDFDSLRRLKSLPPCRPLMKRLEIRGGASYTKVVYQTPYSTKLARLTINSRISSRLMLQRVVSNKTELRRFSTPVSSLVVECEHVNHNLAPTLLHPDDVSFYLNDSSYLKKDEQIYKVFRFVVEWPEDGQKFTCHYGTELFPITGRTVVLSMPPSALDIPVPIVFKSTLGLTGLLLIFVAATAIYKTSSLYQAAVKLSSTSSDDSPDVWIKQELTDCTTIKRASIAPRSFGPLRRVPESLPPLPTPPMPRQHLSKSFSSFAVLDVAESEVDVITRLLRRDGIVVDGVSSETKDSDEEIGSRASSTEARSSSIRKQKTYENSTSRVDIPRTTTL